MPKNLLVALVLVLGFGGIVLAAPSQQYRQEATLIPIDDNAYDLGTTTKRWRNLYVSGTCIGCNTGAATSTEPLMASWFVATSTSIASTFPYASTTALSASSLTSGRVTYAGTGGLLQDSANLTFDGTHLSIGEDSLIKWAGSSPTGGLDWFQSGTFGSRLRIDPTSVSSSRGDLVFYDTTSGSESERFRVKRTDGSITVQGSLVAAALTMPLTTGGGVGRINAQRYTNTVVDSFDVITYGNTGANQYQRFAITQSTGAGAGTNALVKVLNATLQVQTKAFIGGTTAPTALLHLAAGTATANTAPLKFTSGTLLTAAEAGTVEYLSNQFYIRGSDGLSVAGNVGIGTTSPSQLLSVHGNGLFSGDLAAAGITATGTIASTKAGLFFTRNGASTSHMYMDINNDGGRYLAGVEGSSGGVLFNGTTAYASVFGSVGDDPVQIATNNTVMATFSGTSLGLGVTPSLGVLHIDKGTGVGQATLDGSTGGCIMLRDTDDAGWTEVDALDGVLTASVDADGQCD